MKKTLFTLLICFISISIFSQDYKDTDYYYYDGIEDINEIEISPSQKKAIIDIKKGIGKRHQQIGRDRSLSGYEKGQAHRKLNQQIRKEIDDILDSKQRTNWHKRKKNWDYKSSDSYRKWHRNNKRIEAIEDQIDDIEDYYDDLIDEIEDDESIPKAERKALEKALEREMDAKIKELKRQKKALKRADN